VNSAVASTESGSFLDYALAYAERGKLPVVPLRAGEKFPPLLENWPTLATTDAQQIRAWWTQWPSANIGVVARGLVIVDVDVRNNGDASLAALELQHGKLPETFTARTPTGGRHIYLRLPEGHPGAGNSAGKLGSGIDIKGQAGYVLGVGSRVAAGEYTFEGTTDIAQAPAWLLELLGTASAKKSTTPASAIPDAPDAVVERAAEWLALQPEAVEGDGGDHRTYATACGLRDRGVSEAQAVELLAGEWNERCAPPWTLAELETKAANAFRYAENAPGCMPVVTAADFKAVPAPAAKQPSILFMEDLRAEDVVSQPWQIDGIYQPGLIACVYGEPGEGKSVLCLDQAHAIASGRPWFDRFEVMKGGALYLALEGQGATSRRLLALRKRYRDAPIALAGARLNILTPEGQAELATLTAVASVRNGRLGMIVIDTWARLVSMAGGDENSASDVGRVADALERLASDTGAAVVVIHHSGKDAKKGARGSTALLGALQSELRVAGRQIYTEKQREGEDAQVPIGFALESVPIGNNHRGKPVTAPVAVSAMVARAEQELSPQAKAAEDALRAIAPDRSAVAADKWQAAFERKVWPVASRRPEQKSMDRAFQRAVKTLVDYHPPRIELDAGQWRQTLRGGATK
jgi:RecA/RadA recombinase